MFADIESELCERLGVEFHWNVVLAQADYNKVALATKKYIGVFESREAVYKKFPAHIKTLFVSLDTHVHQGSFLAYMSELVENVKNLGISLPYHSKKAEKSAITGLKKQLTKVSAAHLIPRLSLLSIEETNCVLGPELLTIYEGKDLEKAESSLIRFLVNFDYLTIDDDETHRDKILQIAAAKKIQVGSVLPGKAYTEEQLQ